MQARLTVMKNRLVKAKRKRKEYRRLHQEAFPQAQVNACASDGCIKAAKDRVQSLGF
jgi:hypothetical protein